jgi:transposase-like protein
MTGKKAIRTNHQEGMPSAEEVQKELATAKTMDDFFGKEGIFARLFAKTMEQMLEAELSEQLGYEPYEAKGRNSGDSRNGSYPKKLRRIGIASLSRTLSRNTAPIPMS